MKDNLSPVATALRIATALCLGLSSVSSAATITAADGTYTIVSPNYRQAVGPQGWLGQLRADDVEFLRTGGQGGYFYQKAVLPMTAVTRVADNVLRAECASGTMTMTFDDDGVTWSFTNGSKELLQYILVLAPEVDAVREGLGRFHKAPADRGFTDATFFRATGKVRLEGSTKIWGPFAKVHQVWELRINPGEVKEVRVTLGRASDEEMPKREKQPASCRLPPTDTGRADVGPGAPRSDAAGLAGRRLRRAGCEGDPLRGRALRGQAHQGLRLARPARGARRPDGAGHGADPRRWRHRLCRLGPDVDRPGLRRHQHGHLRLLPRRRAQQPASESGRWGSRVGRVEPDRLAAHRSMDLPGHRRLHPRELAPPRPARRRPRADRRDRHLVGRVSHRPARRRRLPAQVRRPVYGCGFYEGTHFSASLNNFDATQRARWLRWWDPQTYLPNAKMPMCGSPAATTSRSGSPVCRPAIAPHRARTPWRSGCACPRPEPGRRTAEIPVFADHLFRGGPGLPRITGQGRDGQRVWCTFESPVPVVKAELNVTRDTNPNWPDRTWEALPATLTNSRVEADLPAGVAVYYLNLTDDRDCVVSTEHEALLK